MDCIGKSNLVRAEPLGTHGIPAPGAWAHAARRQGNGPLAPRVMSPCIPLQGAVGAALVKYPG